MKPSSIRLRNWSSGANRRMERPTHQELREAFDEMSDAVRAARPEATTAERERTAKVFSDMKERNCTRN